MKEGDRERRRGKERGCTHTNWGGAEREGEREFQAGSTPSTEPDAGLDPRNHEIMTSAKIKS